MAVEVGIAECPPVRVVVHLQSSCVASTGSIVDESQIPVAVRH